MRLLGYTQIQHDWHPYKKEEIWTQIGFPQWLNGKESACPCRRCGFDPWIKKIPWRREQQSTPGFLPGEFHGQRSLVGYSPWGRKELDVTLQRENNNKHTRRISREEGSSAATSQGAARSWESSQEQTFPSTSGGGVACQHHDLEFLASKTVSQFISVV